jgi:parallel beta-helix repeat protein
MGRRHRGVVIAVAAAAAWCAAAGSTSAAARPGAPSAPRDTTVIGCDQAAVRVEITADRVLDPACTYTAGFDITASGVTLDCRGARIDAAVDQGVGIAVTTPADADLHDVTVTNCRVSGFLNAVRVSRTGFRQLAPGTESDHGTADIAITDNELSGTRGVGLYVDGYVSDVTITGNEIHDTGSSGIYLEAGSSGNRIEGNDLVHNGYTENGADGQTFDLGGTTVWYWGTGREGISVDGSSGNVIRGNRLERNSFGGILLYKNCGEFRDSATWFERRTPATGNLIEGNDISQELNGVWVGSRMGENTLPMDCSDPAYVDRGGLRVTLDRAPGNVVRANTFTDVTYGVRVEDDDTTVEHNTFRAPTPDHHAVIIGTPYRTEVLDRPVAGTVLRANSAAITGNDSPYRWVHGQARTVAEANRALGRPAALCEGEPPPRQLFVMVVAVSGANPDGSKPPTPDLTIPTLGALPSCQRAATSTTSTTPSGPTGPSAEPTDPVPATAVTGTPAYTG